MSISEQVNELRKLSKYSLLDEWCFAVVVSALKEAADTIESLYAKLQAANMERSADTKMIDGYRLLKDLEKETFTADLYEHGWDGQTVDYLLCLGDVKKVIDGYGRSTEDCGGWIACKDRLPEDDTCVLAQVNGKYKNITFENAFEFATYIKGEGWILEVYPDWYKPNIVAWRELPEPYHEP